MVHAKDTPDRLIKTGILVAAFVVFWADLVLAHRTTAAGLYSVLLLATYWSEGSRFTIWTALLCVLMTALGDYGTSPGHAPERVLSMVSITLLTVLLLIMKRLVPRIRESEIRFKQLVKHIPGVFYLSRNDERYSVIAVSGMVEEISGFDMKLFADNKKSFAEIVHPEDLPAMYREVDNATSTRSPYHLIYRIVHRDGSVRWCEEFGAGVFDDDGDGELKYLAGFIHDITARRQMESELERSEARFRGYFSLGLIGMGITSAETKRFIEVNDYLCKLLGYNREELLTKTWVELTHPQDAGADMQFVQDALRGKRSVYTRRKRYIRKDGRIVTALISVSFIKGVEEGSDHFVGLFQDITDLMYTAAVQEGRNRVLEMAASGASIEDLLAALSNIVAEVQPGLHCFILFGIRERDERILGSKQLPEEFKEALYDVAAASRSRAVGKPAVAPRKILFHTGSGAVAAFWQSAETQGFKSGWLETVASSDGAMLGTVILLSEGAEQPDAATLELISRTSQGAALLITERFAEEELARYRVHLETLVKERTRELERTNDKLRRSERLAAIGTLAAGIAHEINNPLGMIQLQVDSGLETVENIDATRSSFSAIREDVQRCAAIVKNVLRFAREDSSHKAPVDLNVVVERSAKFTRKFADWHGIQLSFNLGSDPVWAFANAMQLEQVLINLIQNAVYASRRGQIVTVATWSTADESILTVKDTGIGMPAHELSRAFDPFFTTRLEFGGTGLGLSTCHGIITEHGGSIEIESEPGRGTVVSVMLRRMAPELQVRHLS